MKKIQQGDVIIKSVRGVPEGAKRISRTARGFVLAEGETTGHAHVIEDDIEMYEKDGSLFIRAHRPVTIKHEEHNPIALARGTYVVGHVREFDYRSEEIRRIRD